MKHIITRTAAFFTLALFIIPMAVSAQWTAAPANPPSNNAPAPINVSGSNQAKAGGLQVGSFLSDGGAVVMGNLGVGLSPAYKLDVSGDANAIRLCIGGDCRNAWPSGGGASTITINTAGGLTGGGTGSTFNLGLDLTTIQSRVTGTCLGQVMVGINQNGTVSCEPDDAGSGGGALTLDNVIANGDSTNRVPTFQGGINLGNQDASGSDTAGIKAWNTISIYSTAGGYPYTTAANPAIELNARTGDATFKGNVTTADGGYKSGMWCGRGHSTPMNNFTSANDGPDMNCMGSNPRNSCPANFTRVNFATDSRQQENTVYYYTCIRN